MPIEYKFPRIDEIDGITILTFVEGEFYWFVKTENKEVIIAPFKALAIEMIRPYSVEEIYHGLKPDEILLKIHYSNFEIIITIRNLKVVDIKIVDRELCV